MAQAGEAEAQLENEMMLTQLEKKATQQSPPSANVQQTILWIFKSHVLATAMVTSWLLLGTLAYIVLDGMRAADALYFSVQVGFSIGFGSLAETRPESRIYSCFHMITGGLMLGTIIGSWFEAAVDWQANLKEQIKHEHKLAQIMERAESDGVIDLEERAMILKHKCGGFWKTQLGEFAGSSLITFGWIGIGVAFAMVHQQLHFDEALEFAVSAVTTAGLMGFAADENSLSTALQSSVRFSALSGCPSMPCGSQNGPRCSWKRTLRGQRRRRPRSC